METAETNIVPEKTDREYRIENVEKLIDGELLRLKDLLEDWSKCNEHQLAKGRARVDDALKYIMELQAHLKNLREEE